jgi:dephospho-CoA kinase
MIVLGLTGSIGMGKTEAAKTFRRLNVPVFDADAIVHKLLGKNGEAVADVSLLFPDAVHDGLVNRQTLGAMVFNQPDDLKRLEGILHPRVRRQEGGFLTRASRRGEPLVVLDIPLLFESEREARYDATMVVSAPGFVQRGRVLRRPGMTPAKYAAILDRQLPDAEKRSRADFVVPTGLGKRFSLRRIRHIITMLCRSPKSSFAASRRNRHLYA